ncbi:MAG: imidazole glycerol phosphate synthase subunit HisH [Gemmatimonadota bacterium]
MTESTAGTGAEQTTGAPVRVVLFDYGAGNLHSLRKGLEAGGAQVTVSTEWDEALAQDALVLPGVGSFGAAVEALQGHEERVRGALDEGLPCLGICLGMQLLFAESEEGPGTGIGFVPGRVRKLRTRTIPQMGWNDVASAPGAGAGNPLLSGLEAGWAAYYANSFVCDVVDPDEVIARSEYDGESFPAALNRGRTWGVQFHPEKSSTPGLHLLRNFLAEVRRGRDG